MLRSLISVSSEIIKAAYEEGADAFDLVELAEKSILHIGNTTAQGGMVGIQSVVIDAIKKISEWRLNDSTLTGIPTGFPELDRATRGWQNGDLIVIAARPSGGKTAMALNLIRNAALNPTKPVVVAAWSLEMKATFLVLRMLAAESEIILHKIQTGRLTDEEMEKLLRKGADVLNKSQIYFDENNSVTMKSLKSKARRLKKKNNLGMIVIDYLQLMSGDTSKGNREQEISTISRELKNLAQELDVPVIALSQLSREGAKNVSWEVAPPPSALRESGAIEQDADVIIMLWGANEQEQAQDPYLEGKRKIRIVKQRNGVLLTLELDFRSEIQLFESIKNYF
jgi:replicative DNA helicase